MNIKSASIAGKVKVLFLIFIAATLSLGFYVYQGKDVSLVVDGEETKLVTYTSSVEELIQFESIKLKEGAYVNVPLDKKIENNDNIIIKNPKNYNLNDGGVEQKITSVEHNVEDILKDLDIKLGEKDFTYPDLKDKLGQNKTLRIYRVKDEVLVNETEIPFEKEVIKNNKLNKGETKVVQEGKKGLKNTHIKKEYLNGVLTSEGVIKEEVVTEPVKHIVEHGTRENVVPTSRGGLNYRKAITMNASAYDPSPRSNGKWAGITAMGTKIRRGVVAVDPRVIPLGTKLYVESTDGTPDYGFAVAEDTGGAIKGNRIDLAHETHQQCMNFGRRNVKVYVLD